MFNKSLLIDCGLFRVITITTLFLLLLLWSVTLNWSMKILWILRHGIIRSQNVRHYVAQLPHPYLKFEAETNNSCWVRDYYLSSQYIKYLHVLSLLILKKKKTVIRKLIIHMLKELRLPEVKKCIQQPIWDLIKISLTWQQRTRWLDGITQLNEHESEQALGDGDGQGSLVCCSPCGHRVRHNWVTEQQQQI